MRRLVVLSLLIACGNRGPTVPRGKPTVQLVRCAAATPRPQASGEVAADAAIEGTTGGFGMVGPRMTLVVGRRPTVSLGTTSVLGSLSTDAAAAGIRAKLGELTSCYATASATPVRAAVSYRIVVRADGAVSYVDATSGGIGGTLDACVRRTLRTIKYAVTSATTTVTAPLIFDATGAFATPAKPVEESTDKVEPWTPYAVTTTAKTAAAAGAAKVTEAALRQRLGAIETCFARSTATGSLRLMMEIDLGGDLGVVRAGGIGDRDAEVCTVKALAGMKIMTPQQEHVEVACDLARGDAEPWRVSTAGGGYDVIDIEPNQLRHATETLVPGAGDPEPLPAETYVVLARADTRGGMLQLALMWARDANAVLLAVVDGTPTRAPLFLGLGNATGSQTDDDGDAIRPAIRVGGKQATGCVGRATHKATLANPTELGGLMQKLVARCHQIRCAPTLVISIDSDAVTRDLVEVAGAARRAGFDRVLFGGTELGCTTEVKKKTTEPDPEPDFE